MLLKTSTSWINKYRFNLLLVATLLVLFTPAFVKNTFFADTLFVVCMSFLLIQSILTITPVGTKITPVKYGFLIGTIVVLWLEKTGITVFYITEFKFLFLVLFFIFIIVSLSKFIYEST